MVNSSILRIDTSIVHSEQTGTVSPRIDQSLAAELVAAVLTKIIETNNNVYIPNVSFAFFPFSSSLLTFPLFQDAQDNFLKFQSSYEPDIAIFAYLERIRKYSKCSDSCFILMLIYIDRLIEAKGLVINRLNIHRLLITNMMIAAKYHDDLFYNNAYYAKLGGLSLPELNLLELEVLETLNYSMFVSNELFEKYSSQLNNYKFMIPKIISPTITPVPAPMAVPDYPRGSVTPIAFAPALMNPAAHWPDMSSCLNAFQFSPHFVAPQIHSGTISPCGNSSVSSAKSTNTSNYCYSYGGNCSNAFSFSRSGSIDSLNNVTPTKLTPSNSVLVSDDSQDYLWCNKVAANEFNNKKSYLIPQNCYYQPVGSYPPQSHHIPSNYVNNCGSYGSQFPQPNSSLVSYPSFVPLQPHPSQAANYHVAAPMNPPIYPNLSHNVNQSFEIPRQGKSCLKKRAHNDIYEENTVNYGHSQSSAPFSHSVQHFSSSSIYPTNMDYHSHPNNTAAAKGTQQRQQVYYGWNSSNQKAFNEFSEQPRLVAYH
jgi:hypothetical protein